MGASLDRETQAQGPTEASIGKDGPFGTILYSRRDMLELDRRRGFGTRQKLSMVAKRLFIIAVTGGHGMA